MPVGGHMLDEHVGGGEERVGRSLQENAAKSRHEADLKNTRKQDRSQQTWDTIPRNSPAA